MFNFTNIHLNQLKQSNITVILIKFIMFLAFKKLFNEKSNKKQAKFVYVNTTLKNDIYYSLERMTV